MELVDAHTHIEAGHEEQALRLAQKGLWQLVCATNPDECRFILELANAHERIIATYGLHPWYVEDFSINAMDKWLMESKIIGEIGLDTVWAPIPLEVQLDAFVYQLEIAVQLEKPVILHTKGAEGLILDHLRKYTPPEIIIHWYSGDQKYLDGFNELGCYFTLGPDIGTNASVQEVCRRVPMDHILTETDGIEAINWALGGGYAFCDIPEVLISTLAHAALIKGITVGEMADVVYKNFTQILSDIT